MSDGNDTKSVSNTPHDICLRLRSAGVTVDTVSLGDEENRDLRTISHLLGGYSLRPSSLANVLAM